MHSFLATVGVGMFVFAATNVDDLLLLLAFYADATFRGRYIVAGQVTGIAALSGLSLAGALVAWTIPRADLGLLGLVPFALGLRKLLPRRRPDPDGGPTPPCLARTGSRVLRAGSKVLTVAGTALATGADNLAVNVPLFATRAPREVVLLIAVFLLMAAAWCGLAFVLVRRHTAGATVRRLGARLLPWALMAVGLLVLAESRPLSLLRH